jgi:hypothetical protein
MLHLDGYTAHTFVLRSALPTATSTEISKTPTTTETFDEKLEEAEEEIEEVGEELSVLLKKSQDNWETAAAKDPLMLFNKFDQRACAWSDYIQGRDWTFASKASDDVASCAHSCVLTTGCTGFEVGPSTSSAFGSVAYCALWFNAKCGEEKEMLKLDDSDAHGYTAQTFVMIRQVVEIVLTEKDTPLGKVQVEKELTFQPTVAQEHYGAKENEASFEFTQFPQQACQWSDYTQNQDWSFAPADDVESCAALCLQTNSCSGFEVGTMENKFYCAFWFNDNCNDPSSMVLIPEDRQLVATYVLDPTDQESSGNGLRFMLMCAFALFFVLICCAICCVCCRLCVRMIQASRARTVIEQPPVDTESGLAQATFVQGVKIDQCEMAYVVGIPSKQ